MMYTRDDVAIIQGKIPSRRSDSKRYSTTRILNQKTPISMTQKHAWWQQEYPNNIQQGISKHNMISYDKKYIT